MRLFYTTFPIFQTVSGKLSWSHYMVLMRSTPVDIPQKNGWTKSGGGATMSLHTWNAFRGRCVAVANKSTYFGPAWGNSFRATFLPRSMPHRSAVCHSNLPWRKLQQHMGSIELQRVRNTWCRYSRTPKRGVAFAKPSHAIAANHDNGNSN